jgi:hypothetical protein
MDADKPKSIAYEAGRTARLRGEKIENSALIKLRRGSRRYYEFLDGFHDGFDGIVDDTKNTKGVTE